MNKREETLKIMRVAFHEASIFSKAPTTKVSALLVDPMDMKIVAQGVNGFPSGWDGDNEDNWKNKEFRQANLVHAEYNLEKNAKSLAVDPKGKVAFVSFMPNLKSAHKLYDLGVKAVVVAEPNFENPKWGLGFKQASEFFKEKNLPVVYLDPIEVMSAPLCNEKLGELQNVRPAAASKFIDSTPKPTLEPLDF